MKTASFRRMSRPALNAGERGITMILVALCMVAIIAMAALSIDVVTLYLAREEAQRAADAGALAAARVISLSGITGMADPDNDPASWAKICGGSTSLATLTAQAVAQVNGVAGAGGAVTVKYSAGAGTGDVDCTALSAQFGVNPLVNVQVTRDNLPTLFSRIWSRGANTVSATAMAEAFNPSNSGTLVAGGDAVPVIPRCVKPWMIPNDDPAVGGRIVSRGAGMIRNQSIVLNGTGAGIGERFTLTNPCSGPNCLGLENTALPAGNYIPAFITPPAVAIPPSCTNDDFQNAITGCDGNTVYACGTVNGAQADLTANRGADTAAAVQCLIQQPNQDTINVSNYPFQIMAGAGNPVAPNNQLITASNSIVTLPIYDSVAKLPSGIAKPQVTVLGFLQVFVNSVDTNGNMDVYVLNISGCGNDAATTLSAPGTSPVPIRLITPQ